MKRILVACGNGIATSTVVAVKIREFLEEKNINANVEQCKLLEVPSKAEDFDLIVTTGKFDNDNIETPIISGMSLLTGINEDDTLDEIVNVIGG